MSSDFLGMWSRAEVLRLAFEALCLLFGAILASFVSRRRGIALGVFLGFAGGCAL
jgi:hypothetical protein